MRKIQDKRALSNLFRSRISHLPKLSFLQTSSATSILCSYISTSKLHLHAISAVSIPLGTLCLTANKMASPPTRAEVLSLAFSGQENFVPAAEERRPSTFLSLAPTTSASYPSTPLIKAPIPQSPLQEPTQTPRNTRADLTPARLEAVVAAAPSAETIDSEPLKTRRSSSLSSDGSTQKKRFLKLGPVHFGEGDGDWSEEVLE